MIHGDMNASTVRLLRRRAFRRARARSGASCRDGMAVATVTPSRSRSELHLVVDLLRELVEPRLGARHLAGLELRQEVTLLVRGVGADRGQWWIEPRVLVGEDVEERLEVLVLLQRRV